MDFTNYATNLTSFTTTISKIKQHTGRVTSLYLTFQKMINRTEISEALLKKKNKELPTYKLRVNTLDGLVDLNVPKSANLHVNSAGYIVGPAFTYVPKTNKLQVVKCVACVYVEVSKGILKEKEEMC